MKKWLPILIFMLTLTAINIRIFCYFSKEIEKRDQLILKLNAEMPKVHVINEVYGPAQKIKKHIQKRSKLSLSMTEDVTYSIIYESQCNNLEPELVTAIIDTESSFDSSAKSEAGACGLMQLMPVTFQAYGGGDIWDIQDNMSAGCKYLADLKSRFKDDYVMMLAGYNAGPSRKRSEVIQLAGNYPGKVNRGYRSLKYGQRD